MKQLFSVLLTGLLTGSIFIGCGDSTLDGDRENDSTAFKNTGNDRMYTDSTNNNTIAGSSKEADFIREIVESTSEEIKLAQLASQKSANTEIKQIARMLEEDHTAALDKLKQVTAASSIIIVTGENDDARDAEKKLSDKTGNEFDKDWCKIMIDNHDKTINKMEISQNDITDASLKSWVAETLPKIRMHHDKLMACNSKLK